jgi:hypothetical protein
MKCSIFCDVTLCSPLKANRHFGETCRLPLQGRRISQARNQREANSKLCRWRWRLVPLKRRLIFNGLRGVISQKMRKWFWIIITVDSFNSEPTNKCMLCTFGLWYFAVFEANCPARRPHSWFSSPWKPQISTELLMITRAYTFKTRFTARHIWRKCCLYSAANCILLSFRFFSGLYYDAEISRTTQVNNEL